MLQMLNGRRVAAMTLGCKVNQYETDSMLDLLQKEGCVNVPFTEEADIYIVNTCSVTNMAERKSRQMLHRAKKRSPESVVVACGCYVQSDTENLKEDIACDLLIGNDRKHEVAWILSEYLAKREKGEGKEHETYLTDVSLATDYEAMHLDKPKEHTRAYLKVQDGCNSFCTYCIIPYARGRERSRKLSDVKYEAAKLAMSGIREIILTGINVSAYRDGENTLIDLIETVCGINGIERVRMSSVNPRVVTPEFVKRVSACLNFCPHFHLSLQSACDETLRRMNRRYTVEEYKKAVRLLCETYDRPAITTDVIVGFPGETEDEFETTVKNLEELALYEMHVFKYSPRRGTVAEKLPDQIPDAVKDARSERLLAMTAKQKTAFEAGFSGETADVLVEEVVKEADGWVMRGHTDRYILCDIPCASAEEGEAQVNRMVSHKLK